VEAEMPGTRSGVSRSSNACITAAKSTFEDFVVVRFEETLDTLFPSEPSDEESREYLSSECKPYKLAGGSTGTHDKSGAVFNAWRTSFGPKASMARALRDILLDGLGNMPIRSFNSWGRRCGFVGPRGGSLPRLRCDVSLLTSMVIAGTEIDDPAFIDYGEWKSRIATRFGIVFDATERTRGLRPRASEEDLEGNSTGLTNLMASVGLARRHNDAVTEVINPISMWKADHSDD